MPSEFGNRQKLLAKSRSPPSERSDQLSASPVLDPAGGAASTPAIDLLDPLHEPPPTSTTANARPDSASHYSVLTTEPTPTATATSAAPESAASTASASSVAEPQSKQYSSLWQLAFSCQLKPKQRQILSQNSVGKDVNQIASEIGDFITGVKDEKDGKEWKVSFGKDVIIMMDVVTKTLRWVHKFREIGDMVTHYDPQHAALPWAGFRFLLEVCVDQSDALDSILIGLEKTICIIARCAIYELLYLDRTRTVAASNLEKSIVKLYSEILKFVADGIAKSKEGYFSAAFSTEMTDYLTKVRELEETVEKDASAAEAYYTENKSADLRRHLRDLSTTSSRIGPEVDDMQQQLGEFKRFEILTWISEIPYTKHHARISAARLVGTGEWLFQKEEYKEWLSSSVSKLLLLGGIPGTGKTFIASVAIDSFASDPQLGKLAYFYCDHAEANRRDPESILSALIHQLAQTETAKMSLLKPVVDTYESRRAQGQERSSLSLSESQALLVQLADMYELTTICVDALDEVEPSSRKSLLQALKFVMEKSKNLVKIFATTRMDVDILQQFEMFPRIELQPDDNASDIERFIEERIQTSIMDRELLDGAVSGELQAEICKVLGEKSRGMFQLAALQITYLCGMATDGDVRKGLRDLPGTLRNAYQRIYDRILAQPRGTPQLALNAFRWIKFSCEPVRSETLLDAASVSVTPSGEFTHEPVQPNVLLKACQNLIILDKSLNVFRFAHLSVDAFFEAKLPMDDSHTEIAQACLSLVCTPKAWGGYDANVTTHEGQYRDRHLLLYSAVFWPLHFARGKDCDTLDAIWDSFVSGTNHQRWREYCDDHVQAEGWQISELWERIRNHKQLESSLLSCVCAFDISRKFVETFELSPQRSTYMNALLLMASNIGDLTISRLLIDKGADVSARDKEGRTPLHWASARGHDGVVRLLLNKNADVAVVDRIGRTPLHRASERGHDGVVRQLLDNGSDITAADINGWTSLHRASMDHMAVVRLLIDKGAEVTVENKDGLTPLHWVAARGREEMMRLLIIKGADVTAADKKGRTPLHWASVRGHEAVVRLLIDNGADVAAADRDGLTALHGASERRHEAMVRLLIEKNGDITAATKIGWTPLHEASKAGREAVMQLLIDNGADVAAASKDGWTPLHEATKIGRETMVRLLIGNGGDATTATKDGWTPLHEASKMGHEVVAGLLIGSRSDATTATKDGWTPLHEASKMGHEAVARLLIDNGADVTAATKYGWTPLHEASKMGHEAVVRLLIEMGADNAAADKKGWTPLHRASERGHEAVVRLLIDTGAGVTDVDNDGCTPLHWASDRGHEGVVRLLIDTGADVTDVNNDGCTPLHMASKTGNEALVRLLIDKGADVTAVDNSWRTPIHWASVRGHEAVVRLLIDKGADVTAATNNGWTPLHWASEKGHVAVVRLLIDKIACVTDVNNDWWTPLHTASKTGHDSVVRLLIDKGADVTVATRNGWTPLHEASVWGHAAVVRLLVGNGANVAAAAKDGWTPLHWALERGHEAVVRLLVDSGADVTAANKDGWTPLQYASERGHEKVVRLLIDIGADVTAVDKNWRTPLHWASVRGHEAVVRLLIDNGADVTAADKYGRTPLHGASERAHEAVVRLLVDNGADVTAADKSGHRFTGRRRGDMRWWRGC